MINDLIKKLRKAANALDELLESEPTHNRTVEKAIHKAITRKKYKLKGKHWTQKPENKHKLANAIRKVHNKE